MEIFLILLAIVVVIAIIVAVVAIHPLGVLAILLLAVVIMCFDTCTSQCSSSKEETPTVVHKENAPVDSSLIEPLPANYDRHREAVRRTMIKCKRSIEEGFIKLDDEQKEIWEELKREGKV